jgi:single-strand DNA-binding protein
VHEGEAVIAGLNKVILVGRVGRDPEMRFVPSGKAVTSFNIAVPRSLPDADGDPCTEIEWFNVVAWGALAESCKARLAEGMMVYVGGSVQTRTWVDLDGVQCVCTEVVASEMTVLSDTREE